MTEDEIKFGKERALFTALYSYDEVRKLIEAFQNKYNISPCDGLPYMPQRMLVKLSGEVMNENDTSN